MPADYTAAPGLNDYKVLLQSIAVYPTDATQQARCDEQLTNIAAGVWRELERRTGKRPFLVQGAPATLYFDATDTRGLLNLGTGLNSLTSVTVNGTAQTLNEDFWLEPNNAAFNGEPHTALAFAQAVYLLTPGARRQIAVAGIWGWHEEAPADVWIHCLRYGCALALGQLENISNVASLSQDGFSKGFDVVGVITQKDLEQVMQKRFDTMVMSNQRVIC